MQKTASSRVLGRHNFDHTPSDNTPGRAEKKLDHHGGITFYDLHIIQKKLQQCVLLPLGIVTLKMTEIRLNVGRSGRGKRVELWQGGPGLPRTLMTQ